MKKLSELPLRTKILFGLFGLVAILWVYSVVLNFALEQSLKPIAEEKLEFFKRKYADQADMSFATIVTAHKEQILVGATQGKVEVCVRQEQVAGSPQYSIVQFSFVRQWVETESGGGSREESEARARKAFGE